jgi:hypothetical protein
MLCIYGKMPRAIPFDSERATIGLRAEGKRLKKVASTSPVG